ncbi:MAG TPA: transposase [Candidatus Deferrimicrobium sp.]|nr:transposase [Candidatus Deferrimicrobium sp.]
MQTKREIRQTEMMLLPPLEEMIPADHRLRGLQRVLDLGFVHDAVRERYCQDNGRPSVDPEVILRLFLLQAITGCRSVRSLLQEVDMHLGYRWFIGYGATEPLPDHSTLSRALDRFGDDVFNEIFTRSVAQCQKSGLIEGKMWHVDATTIRADLDKHQVNQPDSADPEGRFGRFADGSFQPGYKQQTVVDDRKGVIVGLSVTAANEADDKSLLPLVDRVGESFGSVPEVVCADGAYASGDNAAAPTF